MRPAPRLSSSKSCKQRFTAWTIVDDRSDELLFGQDSAADLSGRDGLGQMTPQVASRRKRRRSSPEAPVGCAGGEPPCYQHLLEDLWSKKKDRFSNREHSFFPGA